MPSSMHLPSLRALSSADDRLLASELRAVTVRQQVAIVRTFADLVEWHTVAACADPQALREQFVHELARLGCRTLETAAALAIDVDAADESGVHPVLPSVAV